MKGELYRITKAKLMGTTRHWTISLLLGDLSSVYTTVSPAVWTYVLLYYVIAERIVKDGGCHSIEQVVSSYLKQCMYYIRLYCRANCTG